MLASHRVNDLKTYPITVPPVSSHGWRGVEPAPVDRPPGWFNLAAPGVALQSVRIDTSSDDRVGRLIKFRGRLVGVLVRLDDEEHGPLRGCWFLQAGFGPLEWARPEPFKDLREARDWARRFTQAN